MSLSLTSRATGSLSGKLKLTVAAFALAPAIMATPSFAQKGPAAAGADVLDEGYNFCLEAVAGLDYLIESLTAAGFTIDENSNYGPYQTYVNASKLGDGTTGDKYVYATLETYPTTDLVYCTYEVEGPYRAPNYDGFVANHAIDGDYQALADGTFGVWEQFYEDGSTTLFLVQDTPADEYFYFQLDWVGPGYGMGGGSGGGK